MIDETVKETGDRIYASMKGFRVTNHHVKKCALAAVGEILLSDLFEADRVFWVNVKSYITDNK